LYAIFDQAAGAREYPFFNAYTTFSGANNRSWYKSKVFYGPQSNNGDTLTNANNVGLTLAYTGTDNPALFSHIPSARRIKYEVKVGTNLTDANPEYASEFIKYLTLQTSSQAVSAGNYNFRLLETGMFTSHASFGQLRLKYNLTGKVAATIYATTDNSGDGALSDVHSIKVFDSPLGLRAQDYTITARDEEIIVDIQLNAATLAYLSNRSELTHIVIALFDASGNVLQDASGNVLHYASYNVLQDASGNNILNLNHSFTTLTNGNSYTIGMQLVALNPNPSESTEVINGDHVYEENIVPLATSDAISVTATGSDQKVTFNWYVPTEEQLQGGTFVKYVIKYRGSSGTAVIREETNINVTSYELTGLTNGTRYYFTFYIVTLDPNTSSQVNGDATDLDEKPFKEADAPTQLTLTPGDEQMTVNWPAAVFNGSVFDYYRVELFSGAVGSGVPVASVPSVQVSSTSHTFLGLANGTSYYARVTVYTTNPNNVNDQRQGGTITASSSKIPFRAANAPVTVVVVPDDEEITVTWSASVLNGGVFKEYLVELFPGSHSIILSSQSTLSHTFTGVTNGTAYYGRVTVYTTDPNNSSVTITGGSTSSNTQIPFRDPDVPTLTTYPGYQSLRVVWSNINLNGGRFEKFRVQLYDSTGTTLIQPEETYTVDNERTHTFTGLTTGVTYVVKVIVVTSNPNAASPAFEGNTINSEGSNANMPHDNPIIIGSATINNATKTVSVTVDKNGSDITDYMAIVQPGNLMHKINDSTPDANYVGGPFTLSITFNTSANITSALMVVGNGRGFTAVEFNGSTQTVLSPEHYRATF
jgi:hypothetical protein